MNRKRRDPHVAIAVAAARGVGICLSADEVAEVASNDGVGLIASNIMRDAGVSDMGTTVARGHSKWMRVDPRTLKLKQQS